MKVLISKKGGYGARDGRIFEFGDIADLDEALAVKLLQHGIAKPAPKPEVKTAAATPPENAAKRVFKPASKSKGKT